MTDQTSSNPQDRRPHESGKWYRSFLYYLELGPRRSLARAYRELANQERQQDGRPLLPTTASVPYVWRKRAQQFDWHERADDWNQQQRLQELEQVDRGQALARQLVAEAIETLKLTMRSELPNPDGSLTEGQNCTQRRLAAEKILEIAGLTAPPPEEPQPENQDLPKIREIRIIDPHSHEGIERQKRIRAEVNVGYERSKNVGPPADQITPSWYSDD
jgi:hypothetical protein